MAAMSRWLQRPFLSRDASSFVTSECKTDGRAIIKTRGGGHRHRCIRHWPQINGRDASSFAFQTDASTAKHQRQLSTPATSALATPTFHASAMRVRLLGSPVGKTSARFAMEAQS